MNPLKNLLASTTIRTRLATAVLAAGMALAAAPSAQAQFGGRSGMATLFVPDFLPRDLPVFVDSLQLEEWQRPILEALLDDYNTNFQTAAEGVRQRMGNLRDVAAGTSADRVVELIRQPLEAWANEKRQMSADFLVAVRSQLSEVQMEQWPRLERAMRREKSLAAGELSGESLNLLLLYRELEAPPIVADGARSAIEDYELRLDEALSAREQELDAAISPLLSAMSTGDNNTGIATQERIMARRVAVRDVQLAALEAISSALGAEYGDPFRVRALQRAFPQVYRADPITPMLDSAEALPDLTDDQKTRLAAVRNDFGNEHGALQARMVDTYRTVEPREPRRRTELAQQKAAGATIKYGDAPEIEAVRKERDELYGRYRARIAEILNDAQREAVPGFGKPGADLDPGQKYQEALRDGGSGRGGKAVDPENPEKTLPAEKGTPSLRAPDGTVGKTGGKGAFGSTQPGAPATSPSGTGTGGAAPKTVD